MSLLNGIRKLAKVIEMDEQLPKSRISKDLCHVKASDADYIFI